MRRETELVEASTLVVVADSVGDAILSLCRTLCIAQSFYRCKSRYGEGDGLGSGVEEMSYRSSSNRDGGA